MIEHSSYVAAAPLTGQWVGQILASADVEHVAASQHFEDGRTVRKKPAAVFEDRDSDSVWFAG
jgi:hypothetical protein